MKKCVLYNFFGNQDYKDLLLISLKSLNKFFDKKDIFVFTDKDCETIKKYANVILFNFLTGHAKAAAARYKTSALMLENYDKVLYLDLDTICISEIDSIFYKDSEEILVASEVPLADNHNNYPIFNLKSTLSTGKIIDYYWAGPLLSESEKKIYSQINTICSGVFLCNKKNIFHLSKIYEYICNIEDLGFKQICLDQHGFCKYLIENNIYSFDLQYHVSHQGRDLIKNHFIEAKKMNLSVIHFAGGVTPYENKKQKMQEAYNFLLGEKND